MIIEVQRLTKYFEAELTFSGLYKQLPFCPVDRKRVYALKKLSFTIDAGEIVGILGPNGAGKTTLLRILADLLEPNKGIIRICNKELGRGDYSLRALIGYVPSDERSFFWRLSGRDNLEFFARLYGMNSKAAADRTSELLNLFAFQRQADRLFRDYSAGMRKKVAVIRAMLHRPKILLFDEVTNSLDPGSADRVSKLIREYISSGEYRAAVWSTHRLEETTKVCDRVIMIEQGSISYKGSSSEFGKEKLSLCDVVRIKG